MFQKLPSFNFAHYKSFCPKAFILTVSLTFQGFADHPIGLKYRFLLHFPGRLKGNYEPSWYAYLYDWKACLFWENWKYNQRSH